MFRKWDGLIEILPKSSRRNLASVSEMSLKAATSEREKLGLHHQPFTSRPHEVKLPQDQVQGPALPQLTVPRSLNTRRPTAKTVLRLAQ